MSNPKVSIIVPNYNHAPFLKERIESILNQTFQDFELILLDDASTDKSREILKSYKTCPKVSQILFNEQNSGGVFRQWDKGISLAKADYIWIAESDDCSTTTFLETVVNEMDKNPRASVCFTGSYMIDSNSQQTSLDYDTFWVKRSIPEGSVRVFPGLQYLKHSLSWDCRIYNASSAIFRRHFYSHANKAFLSFKYCGDWFFWSELCRFGEIIEITKKLNYFRQSNLRTTFKSYKEGDNYKEAFKVINHNFEIMPFGWYRRYMILGHWLRKTRKDQTLNTNIKKTIYSAFNKEFGTRWLPFAIERINKFFAPYCSKLLLPERDRL